MNVQDDETTCEALYIHLLMIRTVVEIVAEIVITNSFPISRYWTDYTAQLVTVPMLQCRHNVKAILKILMAGWNFAEQLQRERQLSCLKRMCFRNGS